MNSDRPLPGSLSYHPEGSVMGVSSRTHGSVVTFLPQEVLLVDATISLHPFFMHRLNVGPIRLTTIAHVFNYRVTVLRDGVTSATRVGRSRRAADVQDLSLATKEASPVEVREAFPVGTIRGRAS